MVELTSYVLADGITIILYSISFHFILFIQLYPDVVGNYVLRLFGVLNLLCFGRWNSQNLFLLG